MSESWFWKIKFSKLKTDAGKRAQILTRHKYKIVKLQHKPRNAMAKNGSETPIYNNKKG